MYPRGSQDSTKNSRNNKDTEPLQAGLHHQVQQTLLVGVPPGKGRGEGSLRGCGLCRCGHWLGKSEPYRAGRQAGHALQSSGKPRFSFKNFHLIGQAHPDKYQG